MASQIHRSTTQGNFERPPAPWLVVVRQSGYGMRHAASFTLLIGLYLHLTSLLIGRELLLEYVLTPRFDMALAVPMTYAGIMGWLMGRRVIHPNRWHRVTYWLIVVYFTISIPVHVQTYLTQRADYILRFPAWYSYFLLPILAAMLIFAWRLEFKNKA
ncbi:MAG: hypothetical protein DCC55_21010 [Chloroflexi bacterium]|nr:MAG: hypothetical protein DCC55_21010 [Chloroflexota bacterium]